MSENYLNRMMLSSIDAMKKTTYRYPVHWKIKEKRIFLDNCLDWLEKNEYYEYCDVIINEKKKLQKKK
jgi:hypothetical protein|tara:strand:- start:1993 stop:2196 length:204 start_codon:yes stop_codon:yes gene_type:complete